VSGHVTSTNASARPCRIDVIAAPALFDPIVPAHAAVAQVWSNKAASSKEPPVQVFVRDNNVDQALRILKRKMQREGVFKEMRRARFYEKPSEQAARQKSDAVRRLRKQARKQAIRDGLIVVKPKKPIVGGTGRPTSAATTGPGQPSQKPDSP
jgi:small subunit ribosomal protein S21